MKHELPIAIGLLAIGCLPWLWQNRESSEVAAAISTPTVIPQTLQSSEESGIEYTKVLNSPDANAGAAFLRQVADAFNQGESSFGYFEFKDHLFENSASGKGGFWCGGYGSRKSRMEIILESDSSAMVTQICDGRFVYRVSEQNGKRNIKFYNLEKLNNEDAGIVQATLPATWVGSSSITDLFTSLAGAFNFDAMKSSGDGQHVEVVGSWNADHLAKLMVNWVDHREIIPKPDWSKIPPQFPHGARLRFSAMGNRWHPTEILFFRFEDSKTSKPTPTLSVLFGPIHEQSIADELFQIDSSESDATDETDLYNERIDILTGRHRVAEDSSGKIR